LLIRGTRPLARRERPARHLRASPLPLRLCVSLPLFLSHPDVLEHDDRLGDRLAAGRERDRIGPRFHAATTPAAATTAATTAATATALAPGLSRGEVPVDAVDPGVLRPIDRPHGPARGILDREAHVAARRRLQVVADRRPALRVLADE